MVFSKYPYTVSFKGEIPSAEINQLNNQIANALDKTGDNASNGGGISGEIDILSGGAINSLAGGGINIETGSGIGVHSGGNLYIDSGGTSTVEVGGNSLIYGTETVESGGLVKVLGGGEIEILNGGYLQGGSAANIGFYGATVTMSDNLSPVLSSSTLARNIAQPLVLMTANTPAALTGVSFTDVTSTNYWDLMITKLPNGCVITGFLITIGVFTPPTSADATATLYAQNNATGIVSSALASLTIPTGLSPGIQQQTSSSCSVTVDTTVHSYFVRVKASSTEPLVWCAPIIQTTIGTVAQLS